MENKIERKCKKNSNEFLFNSKPCVNIFFLAIFFFLLLNLLYSSVFLSLGRYHPGFFYIYTEAFSDFFKGIINAFNLNDYFKNSNQTYIKKYLNFELYKQTNFISTPFYGFIGGLNSFFFKLINPYLVFFGISIIIIMLGLIGEYIGFVLTQTRNLPLVVEKERINFN